MSETKKMITIPVGDETVIREGKAQEIAVPIGVGVLGVLSAPFDFLSKKIGGELTDMGTLLPLALTEQESLYTPKRSTLYVNKGKNELRLILNEKDPYGDNVVGQLKLSDDLKDFGINEGRTIGLDSLIKIVKKNKHKFVDPTKQEEFILNLMNFSSKVTTVIKNHRDEMSGNSLAFVQRIVAENKHAPSFQLNAEIYIGYPKQVINVQTLIEASGNEVKLYFESQELWLLLETERDKHFATELKRFEEQFPCSVVTVG